VSAACLCQSLTSVCTYDDSPCDPNDAYTPLVSAGPGPSAAALFGEQDAPRSTLYSAGQLLSLLTACVAFVMGTFGLSRFLLLFRSFSPSPLDHGTEGDSYLRLHE